MSSPAPFPFSDAILQKVFAEFSAWTSVRDILKAARLLEDRLLAGESPSPYIVLAFPDNEIFQDTLAVSLKYLIPSYRCPLPKILIAAREDPSITSATRKTLEKTRFDPKIHTGQPDQLSRFMPDAPSGKLLRFFVIEDAPHVLELIWKPVQVWRSMLVSYLDQAWELKKLIAEALSKTGGAPLIFHKPHADSRLPAMLEAIAYYVFGHDIGFQSASGTEIENAFRCVMVRGQPPFDDRILQAARDVQVSQLEQLRHAP